MSDTVIKVEGLSKKFCRSLKRSMYYGTIDSVRSMFGINYPTDNLRKDEFWALKDVSFELKRGEVLGIMGTNGSGKSTLLRLLSGIFPPDKGKIKINGRISPLIAVGAGFHPHMTGRENIFLNGTILGMTNAEIKENYDKIVEFAEIGEFIDAPVSTYSSGMYVRLGFSIAIHSNPDILIADEVLSVGDYAFQMKCYDKIRNLIDKCSVILVSHSDIAIRSVCQNVAILSKGTVVGQGKTDDMILKYRSLSIEEQIQKKKIKHDTVFTHKLNCLNTIIPERLEIRDKNNNLIRLNHKEYGKIDFEEKNSLKFIFDFNVLDIITNVKISFYLRDISKAELTYVAAAGISPINVPEFIKFTKGKKRTTLTMNLDGLTPNIYNVIIGIGDAQNHVLLYGYIDETDNITVEVRNSENLKSADALLNKPYFLPEYKFSIEDI